MIHHSVIVKDPTGDVITDQESEALAKIARLALANSTQTARGTA